MAEDIRYSGEIDYNDVQRTMQLAAEMNSGWHTEAEVREYLHRITGSDIPDTVRVMMQTGTAPEESLPEIPDPQRDIIESGSDAILAGLTGAMAAGCAAERRGAL